MIRAWPWLVAFFVVVAMIVLPPNCQRIEDGIYQAGLTAERLRAGVELREAGTGADRIAYLERAGDGPRVVLIHGFASQKDIWLQLIHELPDSWHVLVPDLPGHGDSAAGLDRDYGIEAMAGGMVSFIEEVAGDEPVHLAGSSLGGAVAMVIAARVPERIESVTLYNPAGAPGAVAPELRRAAEADDNPLIVKSRADFDRMVDLVFSDPPLMPWPAAQVLTRMHIERADLHREIWDDLQQQQRPARDIVTAVRAPVLLVWGQDDRVLDRSSVDFFVAHFDQIEVERLEGVGHTPIIEVPELSGRLLIDIVERR